MKKKILSVLLALGLLASLTACGSKDTAADNAGGDTGYADSINILVYPDYVSEDVLAAFEQEYGIKVNITYTTDYVLIKQEDPDGNYELVTLPDGWYSQGEWMLAIPASSTKTAEAELLINYIHNGKNYADNVMKYPGVPVNEACTQYLTDEYKELFKAFDIPETAHFFTLSSLSSESLEMYDLFISNVMASSN